MGATSELPLTGNGCVLHIPSAIRSHRLEFKTEVLSWSRYLGRPRVRAWDMKCTFLWVPNHHTVLSEPTESLSVRKANLNLCKGQYLGLFVMVTELRGLQMTVCRPGSVSQCSFIGHSRADLLTGAPFPLQGHSWAAVMKREWPQCLKCV